MDEDITIINTNTRNERIKNFFINNKNKLITFLISGILISGISNYIPNPFGGTGRDGPVKSGNPFSSIFGIMP